MFRDVLLSSNGQQIAPVETPLGTTYVRTITAGEKDEFDREARKDGHFRAHLVMLCCCTEDGRPEFTNLDLPLIDALPVATVEPIVEAAIRINRMAEEDAEEIRKKSGRARWTFPPPAGPGDGEIAGGGSLLARE